MNAGESEKGRGRWSRLRVTLALAVAALVALAVVTAGCGSSPGQGVAQVQTAKSNSGGKTSAGAAQVQTAKAEPPGTSSSGGSGKPDAMAFSACMRKNGVPNFPDPDSSGKLLITSGRSANGEKTGVDSNSPQFKKAQQACQNLQPAGGRPSEQQQQKAQQEMLKYAACMRSHGVPKFPDPKSGEPLDLGKQTGVDPNAPAFQSAQQACQKIVPGSPLSTGPPSGLPPQ
jgi:hypothetical protein